MKETEVLNSYLLKRVFLLAFRQLNPWPLDAEMMVQFCVHSIDNNLQSFSRHKKYYINRINRSKHFVSLYVYDYVVIKAFIHFKLHY